MRAVRSPTYRGWNEEIAGRTEEPSRERKTGPDLHVQLGLFTLCVLPSLGNTWNDPSLREKHAADVSIRYAILIGSKRQRCSMHPNGKAMEENACFLHTFIVSYSSRACVSFKLQRSKLLFYMAQAGSRCSFYIQLTLRWNGRMKPE